jgi:hypothetical protein
MIAIKQLSNLLKDLSLALLELIALLTDSDWQKSGIGAASFTNNVAANLCT